MLYTWRTGADEHPEDTVLQFFTDFVKSGGLLSASDFPVEAQTVPDMTVKVGAGRGYIRGASTNVYPIRQPSGESVNVEIQPNSSGNSRIDTVVLYIDMSAIPDKEAKNVFKVVAVQGQAAASPTAPSDSDIATAIGSSNPFTRRANIQVDSGVTAITSDKITLVNTIVGFLSDLNILLNQSAYAEDAGSTDAYAVTMVPAPPAYSKGMKLVFKANTTNKGASTINVNGLGAVAIKKNVNVDIEDGDIKAGQLIEVVYDGTNFQMISTTSDEGVTTLVDAASVNVDSSISRNFFWALGAANRALTATNLKNGRSIYLETLQPAAGGASISSFPSISFTFLPAAVDTTADTITVGKNIKTGTPLVFSSTGGVPAGLTAGTVYYAVNVDATKIKVASSLANAQAGTTLDLTTQGTGTHTVACQIRWNGGAAPSSWSGKYQIDSFLIIPIDVDNGDVRGYVTGDTM